MPRRGGAAPKARGGAAAAQGRGRGGGAAQPSPASAEPPSQTLPSKEQTMFKNIVRLYETKQYKRGVKMADTILKKFPHHGETLAMKGLILNSQEKKEEAYELVKQGLSHNLRSYVCWHVYGILHRSDGNYLESIKCYQQAIRIDNSNPQLLRDLANLQIQSRTYDGFRETRRTLLTNKPGVRGNWAAFAVASHLSGDSALANSVLNEFKKTLDEEKKRETEKKKAQSLAKEAAQNKGPLQTKDKLKQKLEQKRKEQHQHQHGDGCCHDHDDHDHDHHKAGGVDELCSEFDFEYSETLLYRNLVLEESGDIARALEFLNESDADIIDSRSLQEKRGVYLLKLGKLEEAALEYLSLLLRNGENYDYHRGYQQALGYLPLDEFEDEKTPLGPDTTPPSQLDVLQHAGVYTTTTTINTVPSVSYFSCDRYHSLTQTRVDELDEWYVQLQKQFKKVPDAVLRIPLQFLRGDRFRAAFTSYVQPKLRKGIPSLFNSVRSLYHHSPHVAVIQDIFLSFVESLKTHQIFAIDTDKKEDPSVLLWCYYYLANHYDVLGDAVVALEYINKAIEHTPTVVDLYLCKARIYRHGGDVILAAKWADFARELDLADRYLNVKCTKFLLRADLPEKAEATAILFTKDGDISLHDMQAMWYELELAESFVRLKKPGLALKNYVSVVKHFTDIEDDQMDFHAYVLRKMTMRSYVSMLRMENQSRSHQNYLRAIVGIVKIYLDLHDNPPKKENVVDEMANLSLEEQKKYLKKKKKLDAKKAEQEAQAAEQREKAKRAGKKVDEDPEGLKLYNVDDPLNEALKRYRSVENYAVCRIEGQTIGFEVYRRLNKTLLMLRCIKRALRIDPDHPDVHRMIVQFFHSFNGNNVPESVLKVVELEKDLILGGRSLEEFNAQYLEHAMELAKLLAAVEMRILLVSDKSSLTQLKERLLASSFSTDPVKSINSLEDHIKAYEYLNKVAGDDVGSEVRAVLQKKFAFARYFHPSLPTEISEANQQ